jgi:hypothetical protein
MPYNNSGFDAGGERVCEVSRGDTAQLQIPVHRKCEVQGRVARQASVNSVFSVVKSAIGFLPRSPHRRSAIEDGIGVGKSVLRTPLPPNRTGGFPAYGFPVSSCLRRIDRNESGLRADYTGPLSQRNHSASDEFEVNASGCFCDAEAAIDEGDCGSSRPGL